MSQLQQHKSGLREVRRILVEWIATATAALGKKKVIDVDIHDARKQLKKARAALRLLRGAIGEIAYRRENIALRDAARPLGAARDSSVLITALDNLVKHTKSKQLQLDPFRTILRNEQMRTRRALSTRRMAKQRAELRAVVKRSQRWRMQGNDWDVIGDGLTRIYRSGRKGLAKAKDSRDSEDLHDWRKQVKYLWHQLQILQPTQPRRMADLADRCHKLADWLGDDHDLAVLRDKIMSHANAFERKQDLDELLRRLDRRRVQLQDQAFALGAKLFTARPAVFTQRLGKYWQAWSNSAAA